MTGLEGKSGTTWPMPCCALACPDGIPIAQCEAQVRGVAAAATVGGDAGGSGGGGGCGGDSSSSRQDPAAEEREEVTEVVQCCGERYVFLPSPAVVVWSMSSGAHPCGEEGCPSL